MKTKQVLITGATSGIGKATALALAQKGYNLLILARNKGKALLLIDELRQLSPKAVFQLVECDLSSLKSVDAAVHIIKSKNLEIDILINNAGGIYSTKKLSVDGHELTFAMNCLGPFLLTEKLKDILSENARIINLSSAAHKQAQINLDDLQLLQSWSSIAAYGNAKLFNIYTAQYWHQQLHEQGVSTFAVHPGLVSTQFGHEYTGLIRLIFSLVRPLMLSKEKGAETSVFLATEPNIEQFSGQYFYKKKVTNTSKMAQNIDMRNLVIAKSLELIKEYN